MMLGNSQNHLALILLVWKLTPSEPVYKYIILRKRYFCITLQLHSSPVNCAREMFKPSEGSASLRVYNETKIFGFEFFVSDVIRVVGFSPF